MTIGDYSGMLSLAEREVKTLKAAIQVSLTASWTVCSRAAEFLAIWGLFTSGSGIGRSRRALPASVPAQAVLFAWAGYPAGSAPVSPRAHPFLHCAGPRWLVGSEGNPHRPRSRSPRQPHLPALLVRCRALPSWRLSRRIVLTEDPVRTGSEPEQPQTA